MSLGIACDVALALSLLGTCFSSALYNLGLLAALIFFAAGAARGEWKVDRLGGFGQAMLAYVAALVLTSATGVRPAVSIRQVTKCSVLLFGFLVANRARDRRSRRLFLGALAAGAAFAAAYGFYEHWHPGDWEHQALGRGRVAGPASDTIDYSARLTPLLATGLALAILSPWPPPAGVWAWCVLLWMPFTYTQTRSNVISLAAALAAGGALTRRLAFAVALAALLGWAFLSHSPMTDRYKTVADASEPGITYRIEVIRIGLQIAADYFPFGIGRANFVEVHEQRKPPGTPRKHSPHNNYLDLLCETGIFGLAAFLWMHAALARRMRSRLPLLPEGEERAVATAAIVGCTAFVFFGLFHSNWTYFLPPAILMALAGIGWGATTEPA